MGAGPAVALQACQRGLGRGVVELERPVLDPDCSVRRYLPLPLRGPFWAVSAGVLACCDRARAGGGMSSWCVSAHSGYSRSIATGLCCCAPCRDHHCQCCGPRGFLGVALIYPHLPIPTFSPPGWGTINRLTIPPTCCCCTGPIAGVVRSGPGASGGRGSGRPGSADARTVALCSSCADVLSSEPMCA